MLREMSGFVRFSGLLCPGTRRHLGHAEGTAERLGAGRVCHLENLKPPTGNQGVSSGRGDLNVHQTYTGMGAHGGS